MSALEPRRLEVTGSDGVRRSLDEHYDCLRDVQQDPCGAHCAIHAQAMRIAELEAENERLRATLKRIDDVSNHYALTPTYSEGTLRSAIQSTRNLAHAALTTKGSDK